MTQWLQSVMTGSVSTVAPIFGEGDTVDVLNASRLPTVEEVRHTGEIVRVQPREGQPTLYWIAGHSVARSAKVLRLVRRAVCYACDGDGFEGFTAESCRTCGGSGRRVK